MIKILNVCVLKRLFFFSTLCMLAGCATGLHGQGPSFADREDAVIEISPDQQYVKSDEELAAELSLPSIELDAEILEDLLVMNLASYQGQWATAADRAKTVAAKTRDHRVARLATLLALRNNDYSLGLKSASLWYDLDPNGDDPLNMLIITQLGVGDLDGLKNSVSKHAIGKDQDAHIRQIAALLTRQKNKESSLSAAAFLLEAYPKSAQAALSAAYVAEVLEKYEQSEAWVVRALELRPGWELAAQMKAKILGSQGKTEERAQFVEEYAKSNLESVAMRINYAAEMVRQGKPHEAYDYVQEILENYPRNTDALRYAGALAEDKNDNVAATRYYQRALNIDPSSDEVRWSLARRLYIDKNYKSAERHFNDIRSEEYLFDAQIQVANSRYEIYGLESAINTLVGLEPETEREYVSLALTRHYLLMAEYKYEEALGAISEIIYYLPQNHDLIYARALAAAELKRLDIAEPDLRTIFEAKPDHANALNALGYTLADQTDRLVEARELIEKAYKLRPNDAHILDSMGWIAYQEKDYATAIEFLQRAFEASEEVEIAAHLGEVLWESGEKEKAKKIWLEWAERDGDNRLLVKTMERYGVMVDSTSAVK